jgi:cytochrome c553
MGSDPDNPGQLAALTIMYKVEGFNPEANDWFWVKAAGDGSEIEKEGAVGGCIGCHGQPNNADYLLRYAFGEEPAVPSLRPEATDEETSADIRSPQELYSEVMGCAGCHNIDEPQTEDNKGQIGPNHGNLYETGGDQVPGQDAETYVYNSIVDPQAHVVEGYSPIMPQDFADRMSEEEIRALVAWLLDPNREQ